MKPVKWKALTFALALTLATHLSAQTFSVLHNFTGGDDGAAPFARLILSGNTLYGTTYMGGSSDEGTVFSVNTNGTGFAILHSFSFFSDGSNPLSTLALSGNTLYGTTLLGGGSGASGTMFSVNTVSTNISTLYSFSGGRSWAGVIIYGTTLYGGLDSGTVFSINTDGTDITTLTNVGGVIQTGLILSGNTLYGTTLNGGNPGNGTVFSVNTDGTEFTALHSFTAISNSTNGDGAEPYCCLILSQNILYGTTDHGGRAGNGTVFAVNTDGTCFTVLHNFTTVSNSTNNDGIRPQAGLILSGNTLFGTADAGGSAGNGTVFAVNTDGTRFTVLHSFTAIDHNTGTNSDGTDPLPGLILSGNTLYGAANGGGNYGAGTVFALSLAQAAPVIATQPQSQAAPNGSNVTFSVVAIGVPPPNYQWLFNGQNIPNSTNVNLTLNSVTAANSGGYSVAVSNSYGSVTSATASLAVLTDGANGNTPAQITMSSVPEKSNGANSLVFVTHGWQPKEFNPSGPPSQSWMVEMTNAIAQQLAASGKSSDWQVEAYYWLQDAWTEDPNTAVNNAKNIGSMIGNQIGAQGWQHVHLIAHSVGAALIQAITEQLKLSPNPPIVQETFLDPFTGRFLEGRGEYGLQADWADDYFVIDLETDDLGVLLGNFPGSTSGQLEWAYNVDVGGTLEAAIPTQYIIGNGTAGSTPPVYISPSHDSPVDFYTSTVDGTAPSCATGYGFSLSAEAGGSEKWAIHSINNPPYPLCGVVSFSQKQQPIRLDAFFDFSTLPSGMSSGVNLLDGDGASMSSPLSTQANVKSGGIHPLIPEFSTNIPAWLAVGVTISNAVNFVQFEAAFTDANAAEGLLTVYWNTNQIGMVDERVADSSLQTYRFALPAAVTDGLYALSFRLDSFNNTTSSVTVTNVSTGFVGVTQPIMLGISITNGAPLLQLTAATNFTYLIQSSTNLADWMPTALLLNTSGTLLFLDSPITNSKAMFYRALMP